MDLTPFHPGTGRRVLFFLLLTLTVTPWATTPFILLPEFLVLEASWIPLDKTRNLSSKQKVCWGNFTHYIPGNMSCLFGCRLICKLTAPSLCLSVKQKLVNILAYGCALALSPIPCKALLTLAESCCKALMLVDKRSFTFLFITIYSWPSRQVQVYTNLAIIYWSMRYAWKCVRNFIAISQ